MQFSVRSPSLSTVPYSMKNQIICFYFSSDVQYSSLRSYNHKIGICEFQLRRIEFNVPRTNFSINNYEGKIASSIEPDQVNSILERLRYNQTGC